MKLYKEMKEQQKRLLKTKNAMYRNAYTTQTDIYKAFNEVYEGIDNMEKWNCIEVGSERFYFDITELYELANSLTKKFNNGITGDENNSKQRAREININYLPAFSVKDDIEIEWLEEKI